MLPGISQQNVDRLSAFRIASPAYGNVDMDSHILSQCDQILLYFVSLKTKKDEKYSITTITM